MADTPKVGEALDRFEAAIGRLERAMAAMRARETNTAALSGETQALREDRARLAEELDEVRAKTRDLADASQQATRRIDTVMDRVRQVLGEDA